MTRPTTNGSERSKANTRFIMASLFTALIVTIGLLARSASTGANWVVEDVSNNTNHIGVNTGNIAENKAAIVENRVNVQNAMMIMTEMRDDLKELKRFVIGKE